MKRTLISLLVFLAALSLAGCNLSLLGTPTPLPTFVFPPTVTPLLESPTPELPSETPTLALPSPTPQLSSPTPTRAAPTQPKPTATSAIIPGSPSGPYAVVLVLPGDVLNIRSAPGVGNPVAGSFAPTATNVMRTGPSSKVGSDLWVQIERPGGGSGWVNAAFLTETVAPATFCADARVNTLIASLDNAFTANNGLLLSSLVSPTHGMRVNLWRYGRTVTFFPNDARWVFDSTYSHNWGADGASGLDTKGSFRAVVLPKLKDVFDASYTLDCNDSGDAATFALQPWPPEYANVNFYSVYKPGTPGVDLDWRRWLVGVEFVNNQPYVFSLIHFQWEP